MNRVFLSGTVRKAPEIAYTPKGRKVITFPMWVSEGDFSIEVVGAGDVPRRPDQAVGNSVLVAGELIKTKFRTHDRMRVKASKILWTEE